MTYEEAANILDPVKRESALLKYDSFERLGKLKEACQIAAEMLRNATEIKPDCNQPLTLEQLREMEGRSVYNCMVQQWFVIEKIFIKGKLVGSQCDYAEITMSDGTVFCSDLDYDEISGRFYPYPPAYINREAWEKPCGMCGGKTTLYQHTNTTKLFMNTFGKAATLVTECMACPPYADCCMKGIPANSAFKINFCPECGRPLTPEAWAELEKRLRG